MLTHSLFIIARPSQSPWLLQNHLGDRAREFQSKGKGLRTFARHELHSGEFFLQEHPVISNRNLCQQHHQQMVDVVRQWSIRACHVDADFQTMIGIHDARTPSSDGGGNPPPPIANAHHQCHNPRTTMGHECPRTATSHECPERATSPHHPYHHSNADVYPP